MPQTPNQRAWYERNRERLIAKAREHKLANHDEYLAYQKRHREEHLERERARSRQWKAEHQEQHRAASRLYGQEHKEEISAKRKLQRRQLKQTVLDAYGGVCACCGESTYEFLTIDHMNGDGAVHRRLLGCVGGRSHKVYQHIINQGFPPDFRVLCFNCNSARGFYGYCPHHPEDLTGVPPARQWVAMA